MMRAMILAAGMGQRLHPLTNTIPKALIEVGGKALIDYSVETAARAGIDEIIVNLHHLGQMIREHLGDGSRYGLTIRYSVEKPLLGTGGGVLQAKALLAGKPFCTLNADTIIDIDLNEVLAFHLASRATATLVLRKDPQMSRYGLIRIDGSGRIRRFLDTPPVDPCPKLAAFMYTGVQIIDPAVFTYMPENGAFSMTGSTYPRMTLAGERLFGYRFEGRWLTVGTPAELERARELLDASG